MPADSAANETDKPARRKEQEVFADLQGLCAAPGYVHALARLALRDNMVVHKGVLTPEAMEQSYDPDRTVRTEFNTLLGLMLRSAIDFEQPSADALRSMVERSRALLEELHDCLNRPMIDAMSDGFRKLQAGIEVDDRSIFTRGDVMREAIFYGGESAYTFQYRDFAGLKYGKDDAWLRANKGFGIEDAQSVVTAVGHLPGFKFTDLLPDRLDWARHDWSALEGFALTVEEVTFASGVGEATVRAVLDAFTAPPSPCNDGFRALGDFNLASAQPLIRTPDGAYLSLQAYGVIEALYDSPFYWMATDPAYKDTASAHRVDFTEDFVAERLATVFGAAHVHRGVTVLRGAKRVTDIDVLVVHSDRAIVLQCKAKRLTLEARKGNDLQLQDDFKKAVQHAYDQARTSALSLGDPALRFELSDGAALTIAPPRAVYPVCVVADHYPALTVQARHFLKFEADDLVHAPFATDVFVIDTMAEMLTSPLRFLSYLDRRVGLADKITTTNEFAVLGYHLAQNLWIDEDVSLAMIADDHSIAIDTAMTVRREGLVGTTTPKGILDRFEGTLVGRIVAMIERSADPALLNLGFMLLTLSSEALDDLGKGLERIAAQTRKDGGAHDFTMVFDNPAFGLTVHCSLRPNVEAMARLRRHCEYRKHVQKADRWYGLLVRKDDGMPKLGLELNAPWKPDATMDEATREFAAQAAARPAHRRVSSVPTRKVGRNEPCPCGSGLKYKKCHGR